MNEQLKHRLEGLVKRLNARPQSEKLIVLGMLIAGLVLVYLSLFFDPIRGDVDRVRAQIVNVTRQIEAQQASYAGMLQASQQDPNRFANERLVVVQREQSILDREIEALAGNLVTPLEMTQILTTVLEQQSGLELVRFANVSAQPLRLGLTDEGLQDAAGISGQVFEHGLVLEFTGDFFTTLKYLRYLEDITGSFFWDSIEFSLSDWPEANVVLEIHTLSTDQGFMGV